MNHETTTWSKSLNCLINWLKTDKAASPEGRDVQLSAANQAAFLNSALGKNSIFRVVLTVEREDLDTGRTSMLDDYTLVVSPVLIDRTMAAQEWLRIRNLIDGR